MRIATWNVNSLKARLARVEGWITEHQPDILLMQETKLADAAFPTGAFSMLGYEAAYHGTGRWNGVAIVSKVGLSDIQAGFHDDEPGSIEEARIVSATCGGTRVVSVYVPNGRVVDSEFYVSKLEWLARLRSELDERYSPDERIVIGGDFNVAPEDDDVYDITQFVGQTHVTDAERTAVRLIRDWGLVDSLRVTHPEGPGPFSWWDYRAGNFHKGYGMRIDHLLVSGPIATSIKSVEIDRDARKGPQPSDHAPVVLDFDGP